MTVCLLISNCNRFISLTTPSSLSKMLKTAGISAIQFFEFNDDVIVNASEISWKLFKDIHKKD